MQKYINDIVDNILLKNKIALNIESYELFNKL